MHRALSRDCLQVETSESWWYASRMIQLHADPPKIQRGYVVPLGSEDGNERAENANASWYEALNDTPGRVGPPIQPPPEDIRQRSTIDEISVSDQTLDAELALSILHYAETSEAGSE